MCEREPGLIKDTLLSFSLIEPKELKWNSILNIFIFLTSEPQGMSSSDLKAMPKMFFASTYKRETFVEEKEEEANRLQIKILKIWGRFQLVSGTILT